MPKAIPCFVPRRLVFSVLIGNGDMHLKNWSLLYPDGRKPVLSPAYDFVSTLPYIPGDTSPCLSARPKALRASRSTSCAASPDTARLPMKPVMDIVRDTVEKTQRAWKQLPQKDLLPHDILKVIDCQIANAISKTKLG